MSQMEAALFVEGLLTRSSFKRKSGAMVNPIAPDTHADATKILTVLQDPDDTVEKPRVAWHRHTWAMQGGENDGSGFQSYFQLCLVLSGYK
jgi:hypothetical protein